MFNVLTRRGNFVFPILVLSILILWTCSSFYSSQNQSISRSVLNYERTWTSQEPAFVRKSLAINEAHFQARYAKRMKLKNSVHCPPGGENRWLCGKAYYYMYYLAPLYTCYSEFHLAVWGEGGKWVCDIPNLIPRKTGIVYSIGSNGETAFEAAVYESFQIKSFAFDPTLNKERMEAVKAAKFIHFHEIGLTGSEDLEGSLKAINSSFRLSPNARMMRLGGLMSFLKHSFVDILKIDCEGCEEGVIEDVSKTTSRNKPLFGQILIEMHRLRDVNKSAAVFDKLENLGYRLFHGEPNFFVFESISALLWEFSFVHESLVIPK